MIDLKVLDSGDLELSPDDIDALQECDDLVEALERNLCNGWELVAPEECGALTSGLLISNDVERDDHGNLTALGTVYWDRAYETVDTLELLKSGEKVVWPGVDR